jgi:hypothetical protein
MYQIVSNWKFSKDCAQSSHWWFFLSHPQIVLRSLNWGAQNKIFIIFSKVFFVSSNFIYFYSIFKIMYVCMCICYQCRSLKKPKIYECSPNFIFYIFKNYVVESTFCYQTHIYDWTCEHHLHFFVYFEWFKEWWMYQVKIYIIFLNSINKKNNKKKP